MGELFNVTYFCLRWEILFWVIDLFFFFPWALCFISRKKNIKQGSSFYIFCLLFICLRLLLIVVGSIFWLNVTVAYLLLGLYLTLRKIVRLLNQTEVHFTHIFRKSNGAANLLVNFGTTAANFPCWSNLPPHILPYLHKDALCISSYISIYVVFFFGLLLRFCIYVYFLRQLL